VVVLFWDVYGEGEPTTNPKPIYPHLTGSCEHHGSCNPVGFLGAASQPTVQQVWKYLRMETGTNGLSG